MVCRNKNHLSVSRVFFFTVARAKSSQREVDGRSSVGHQKEYYLFKTLRGGNRNVGMSVANYAEKIRHKNVKFPNRKLKWDMTLENYF